AARPLAAAPAPARRAEAAAAAGEPGPAAPARVRGPALGRHGNAGAARPVGGKPADGAGVALGELPPGGYAGVGEKDELSTGAAGRPASHERSGVAGCASRGGRGARRPQAPADRA